MKRIYDRIKFLLGETITVWMDIDGTGNLVSLSAIEKRDDAYVCIGEDRKEYPMNPDEDFYETVNYCAPLFH